MDALKKVRDLKWDNVNWWRGVWKEKKETFFKLWASHCWSPVVQIHICNFEWIGKYIE